MFVLSKKGAMKMKKQSRMKKLCCATLILGMLLPQVMGSGDVSEAASGTWKHNAKGWWYAYSNGSYAVNAWERIGGKWYYFGSNGYMVTGWNQIGGKWYYFESSGAMVTGWKQISGKWYYFESSGAMVTGWKQIGRKWYFFANGAMVTGWKQISGKWYFFANGVMVNETRTIGGKTYIFGVDGVWEDLSKLKAGDVFTFGMYEQDNKTSNGQEAIEWTVLDKMSDGRLLVVSNYVLDYQQYNEEQTDVTWETCTLRSWLNDTFLNAAFTEEEQKLIPKTTVKNADNPDYGTEGGNDTKDQVFLLSYDEAKKYYEESIYYDYEDHPEEEIYSETRKCAPTAYAEALGAHKYEYSEWMTSYMELYANGCAWWLRTPGMESNMVYGIAPHGGYWDMGGCEVDYSRGVRPAMIIKP